MALFPLSFVLMVLAFAVTTLIYPRVLSFAVKYNIVDNPNARKLQRVPVPVMGGTTVFAGVSIAMLVLYALAGEIAIVYTLALLVIMYLVGFWDDIKDVPASLRFLVEIGVVWMMILILNIEINDFHGLWGLYAVPDEVSVPLSLIAGVGIINAINLIDGVDGYCSTFGMMACVVFACIFSYSGDMVMFAIALICIGALLPFFFHNVFGNTSKMFLGDGGSLMLGTMLTMFVFRTLSADSPCAVCDQTGLSLVALSLATLAVPVFDTLRVMIFRVLKGRSPFHPDKTHLHHLFIELNFSHLATSGIIVFCNMLIVCLSLICWGLNAGVDWQVYFVMAASLIFTWVFYFFTEAHHRRNDGAGSKLYKSWSERGKTTNFSSMPFWKAIRRVVDSRFFGGDVKPGVRSEVTPDQKYPGRPDPRL